MTSISVQFYLAIIFVFPAAKRYPQDWKAFIEFQWDAVSGWKLMAPF